MANHMFLFFNHHPTREQIMDAEKTFDIRHIVQLPEVLQALWSQIPPDPPEIEPFLSPFKDWLRQSAQEGDYVLIQGDFGATYLMVRFALELGLVPVYATSTRQATEEQLSDGSVRLVHHFIHRRFRKYGM